jgi:general secretion pathway protein K
MALLLVLLIFAMAGTLATSMLSRQSSDVQRSINRFATQQARADVDHLEEEWATERTFPMEDGTIYVRIQDAQGLFNLNWLSPAANNHKVWQQRFTNLLNELGLDVQFSATLAAWFNVDSGVDNLYFAMQPPYGPAYQPCKQISELLLLDGLSPDVYRVLEPYVACLPVNSQLNVNTAPELVLASLDSDFSLADAQAAVASRGDSGFDSAQAFLDLDEVKPAAEDKPDSPGWDLNDFTVKSEFFEVFSRVNLGPAQEWLATNEFLLYRDNSDGTMRVRYRNYSRREARPLPSVPGANSVQVGQTGN